MAALPMLAIALGALEHIATSSAAFDPLVTASCDAPHPPNYIEASPPTPEALGTATHVSRSGSDGSGSVTGSATFDPSLARACEATFQWGIERHTGSRLIGRVDVGGEGVPAGWAVNFDFGAGANATVRSLVAAELLVDGGSARRCGSRRRWPFTCSPRPCGTGSSRTWPSVCPRSTARGMTDTPSRAASGSSPLGCDASHTPSSGRSAAPASRPTRCPCSTHASTPRAAVRVLRSGCSTRPAGRTASCGSRRAGRTSSRARPPTCGPPGCRGRTSFITKGWRRYGPRVAAQVHLTSSSGRFGRSMRRATGETSETRTIYICLLYIYPTYIYMYQACSQRTSVLTGWIYSRIYNYIHPTR